MLVCCLPLRCSGPAGCESGPERCGFLSPPSFPARWGGSAPSAPERARRPAEPPSWEGWRPAGWGVRGTGAPLWFWDRCCCYDRETGHKRQCQHRATASSKQCGFEISTRGVTLLSGWTGFHSGAHLSLLAVWPRTTNNGHVLFYIHNRHTCSLNKVKNLVCINFWFCPPQERRRFIMHQLWPDRIDHRCIKNRDPNC